jgi:6-phosphogluconolactonase
MNAPNRLCLLLVAVVLGLSGFSRAQTTSPMSLPVYIGTYTGPGKGQGIYLTYLDLAAGTLSPPELVAQTVNPTFLALHPNHKFLFAVNEVADFNGKKDGAVTGFSIDAPTGKLTAINQQPSGGPGPCHLSFDPDGKHVLIGNYVGGSFEVLPVDDDGKMAEATCAIQDDTSDPRHPPHGHCIQFDPAGTFVIADDLGLDKIFVFRFDPAKGVLTANDPPAVDTGKGEGPRHLAFHPNGKWAYNINELNSTMSQYSWDGERGILTEVQSLSTLPGDYHGNNTCAELAVHPSGRFIYGSNRGNNSIAIFRIDPQTGRLTPAGHTPTGGKSPRNFAMDPGGHWLLAANQDSGNVVVFKVNTETGELKATGQSIQVGAPVCLTFFPPETTRR